VAVSNLPYLKTQGHSQKARSHL